MCLISMCFQPVKMAYRQVYARTFITEIAVRKLEATKAILVEGLT